MGGALTPSLLPSFAPQTRPWSSTEISASSTTLEMSRERGTWWPVGILRWPWGCGPPWRTLGGHEGHGGGVTQGCGESLRSMGL